MSHPFTFTARRAAIVLLSLIGTAVRAASLLVPSQYPTIQDAIDAAVDGDHVLVSPGTYGKVEIATKNIELSSVSGPQVTTIDGSSLRYSVIFLSDTSSHVHGFTVTRGGGTDVFGGGLIVGGGAPEIDDMIITDNNAYGFGGAMYLIDTNATVHHNWIFGNSAHGSGAGIWTEDSDSIIQDNLIEGNFAESSGGGIEVRGGSPTILRNVIRANTTEGFGGGVFVYSYVGDRPRFADNLIVGNRSGSGGGVAILDYIYDSQRTVWVNNTIADNTASRGHELYTNGVRDVFYNNAFTGDSPGAVYCDEESGADSPVFDHNDVYPSAEGICATTATTGTNISLPPQYTEGRNGHPYHLSPESPLVDAGSNVAARRVPRDLGKRPRIIDGGHGPIVDIGAFEYQPE